MKILRLHFLTVRQHVGEVLPDTGTPTGEVVGRTRWVRPAKGTEGLPVELSNRFKEGCRMVPYPVTGVPF
jgi:hypothetical protein